MKDYLDAALDLVELRNRPMPASTRALELERAIMRVERAQQEVRAAVTKDDEELAKFHLQMSAAHLAKVTKMHGGVTTWKPFKKPKKAKKLSPKATSDLQNHHPEVYTSNGRRPVLARRSEYRGSSELRFRCVGAEQRSHGAHRRSLEVRNLSGGKGTLVEVEGAPIIYRSPYTVVDRFGEFEETMMPGVAAHLIASADCRFLFGHGGLPLARTTAGTMKLHDTPDALRFTATVDTRSSQAKDLVVAIERGDVSQMSVGFVVETDSWDAEYTKRSISRFRSLEDVSAVTYPASPTTSVSLAGMAGRI